MAVLKRGKGIALSWYGTGYGNGFPDYSVATVELAENGDVLLRVGATEVGQGAKTIMPQVCAEALHMHSDQVHMICEDTREFLDSGTAAASRQTYNTGNAVLNTANTFKKAILEEARQIMDLNSIAGLEIQDQKIWLPMLPSRQTTFKEISQHLKSEGRVLSVTDSFTAQTVGMDKETGEGVPYWPYTFNAYGVEVDVDTETGRVHVLQAWCVQDVGRAINPDLVEGQIDGGFVMGLGYALYEDLGVSEGVIKNNKFAKYIIPTAMDIPTIHKYIVEDPENTAPYGAKGIGEPTMVPVAPAILNAIYDAVGVRIYELPATPDVVLKAIVAARTQQPEVSHG
jgi:CO/xanthine dehydrogenase Mo-binding subunit